MSRNADGCEQVDGTDAAGGARYFWGEYLGTEEDGWSGTEAAYVFANTTWAGMGGADCVAYWVVTATASGNTGSCPTCDVGMDVTATYDRVNSTCPEAMYGDDFSDSYAVDLATDGTASWYYAATAHDIGTGYWTDGVGMNFLSTRACVWF
jgi:hypothetical protein